jgi:site-specific recombinase XerD
MLEDGVPLHVVSAQLGLSNTTTTTNIYGHVAPRRGHRGC